LAARAASVATFGQPCVIDVDGAASAPERDHDRLDAVRALLLVPVCAGDRLLGTLSLASRDRQRFTPDDLELVSTVARQIGVAIGNAGLYAAAREREREARKLYEATRHLDAP
jgi:GAF domain-containing protein